MFEVLTMYSRLIMALVLSVVVRQYVVTDEHESFCVTNLKNCVCFNLYYRDLTIYLPVSCIDFSSGALNTK